MLRLINDNTFNISIHISISMNARWKILLLIFQLFLLTSHLNLWFVFVLFKYFLKKLIFYIYLYIKLFFYIFKSF